MALAQPGVSLGPLSFQSSNSNSPIPLSPLLPDLPHVLQAQPTGELLGGQEGENNSLNCS